MNKKKSVIFFLLIILFIFLYNFIVYDSGTESLSDYENGIYMGENWRVLTPAEISKLEEVEFASSDEPEIIHYNIDGTNLTDGNYVMKFDVFYSDGTENGDSKLLKRIKEYGPQYKKVTKSKLSYEIEIPYSLPEDGALVIFETLIDNTPQFYPDCVFECNNCKYATQMESQRITHTLEKETCEKFHTKPKKEWVAEQAELEITTGMESVLIQDFYDDYYTKHMYIDEFTSILVFACRTCGFGETTEDEIKIHCDSEHHHKGDGTASININLDMYSIEHTLLKK